MTSIAISLNRTVILSFQQFYFPLESPFYRGYVKIQFFFVSRNQSGFTFLQWKFATDPALLKVLLSYVMDVTYW